jgi:hypothetical protein
MGLRRLTAFLAAGALIVSGPLAVAPQVAAAPRGAAAVVQGDSTGCSNQFLDGDSRLGPQDLATSGEIAQVLQGYNRLAGLTDAQFISTYWDPTANGGSGGWRFPPDNGYLIANGKPVEYRIPLGVGQDIDRFGSELGAFLAPEGTSYAERALPPMSLDNFDPAFPCNFHEYRVIKSFRVDSGPIAPGFGQPGLGRQYQLDPSLVPGAPSPLTVLWLVQNGFLARVD